MRSFWIGNRHYSNVSSSKSSDTGGVKPVSLEGRLYRERERLTDMSEEERCWRAQWVRDQRLCPYEPIDSKALYKELYNPIRRFYRFPLDMIQSALCSVMSKEIAHTTRFAFTTVIMTIGFVYVGAYYFKYNGNDWTRKGGWRVLHSRPYLYSGEAEFPSKYDRGKPSDYGSRGFENSPI